LTRSNDDATLERPTYPPKDVVQDLPIGNPPGSRSSQIIMDQWRISGHHGCDSVVAERVVTTYPHDAGKHEGAIQMHPFQSH
jgi:hypothetical protein